MRHISNILFALCALALALAIWAPIASWWQWVATAMLLILAAAFFGGLADKAEGR